MSKFKNMKDTSEMEGKERVNMKGNATSQRNIILSWKAFSLNCKSAKVVNETRSIKANKVPMIINI